MSDECQLIGEPESPADLISLAEAANEYPLSATHMANLIKWSRMWGKKYGRNWFTTRAAVEAYLATDRRTGPKTDN